jgi:membrane protein YdbS with pleckstrin-like domain
METLFIKFSGWFLLAMLAMLIVEILAVGMFAASWCLHTIFGHYAIAVVALVALVIALVHEFRVHPRTPHAA